ILHFLDDRPGGRAREPNIIPAPTLWRLWSALHNRHTMAVHMLESGAATSDIRDLLGHQSAATTWRYTRAGRERKRRVIGSSASLRGGRQPVPIWRRDSNLLAQLEAIGRSVTATG